MTYIDIFIKYLEKEKRLSPNTILAYTQDLAELERFCVNRYHEFNPEALTNKQLRDYIASLKERNLENSSVSRKLTTLKSFYKYMQQYGNVRLNPTDNISYPKVPKKVVNFIPADVISRLLDSDYFPDTFEGTRDRFIFALIYYTGIRVSECVNLKMSNYSHKQCTVKVLGKMDRERIVPFTPGLNKFFYDYQEKRAELRMNTPGLMFYTSAGNKIYWKLVYDMVNHYVRKISDNYARGPHVLRHSYATHLLNNGANIMAIKELLGHASVQATTIYTHVDIDRLKKTHAAALGR